MVVRDLSFSESSQQQLSQHQQAPTPPLGPVTDRFVAIILDFLIISPIVSFCVAGLLRDLKTVLILNSDSDEATVIWAFFVLSLVVLSSLIQAVFLFFWQATPGQKFMQLQVVSYPQWLNDREKLSFAQCLIRPLGWWGSALMLGVPFLDVVGHPLRRAIHERMSDTLVISKKHDPVDLPLPIETRYISSTLWIFYGFLFLVGVAFMTKTYKSAVREGLSKTHAVSQSYCSDIPQDKYKDGNRLDMAVALYLAEEVDDSCVYNEAQKVLWGYESSENKALAQLAMALISDDDTEVASYHKEACAGDEHNEACSISKYLQSKNDNRAEILRKAGLGLVSSRILLLGDAMGSKSYVAAAGLIHDLELETPLKAFLDRNMVQVAWSLNEKERTSRSPASAEEQEILRTFKERYQLK